MRSDTRTNVMFVTHADKKGGAEQSLIHLINFIDRTQFRVFLLSPKNANYLHEIRAEYTHFPLELNSIKQRYGFGYLETVMKIRSFVRKNHISIVHANGWRAPWYIAPLKLLTRKKLVWHHRDHTHLRMFNEVLPRFFDRVICISEFVASSIQGRNKTVIYNGVDPSLALAPKSRRFMEDGQLIIGMFGRIVEWKRYDLVIEAVKRLADSGRKDWKLWIVGDASVDGSDHYYEDLIWKSAEYGLENHILFHGYSSKPLDVMKECDVTVNFSLNEPFGRVIIESMLVQTPVIVSDSGGAPEIIRHTDGGLIVQDGDVGELSQALARIYDNPADLEVLSKLGYQNVMKKFDMAAIARQVEAAYRRLLPKGPKKEAAGEAHEYSVPSNPYR
ncbi:glycosyltransferase [Paenibacillus protaetiae]|uniref:Glycosyltransferase family 1 protein n=1 Tax=Paenibacillus protaetiae TaxID=2509456 RepID=A0A4P6EV93_9BACL|nr:glycosyltransferase [Paenibacillus protaetiae]QAY67210.1 glycosyltransferase family 1 protein [Paenibacillus protaetiae]